jgi:AbrB family looped-hinge helix DNA binding protein
MQFIPFGSPENRNGKLIRKSGLPVFLGNGFKTRTVRIDQKGRISIPSEIRKNFGLEEGTEIELVFDLRKNYLILKFSENGQDGACSNMGDCGSPEPGAKELDESKNLRRSVIPGPGPEQISKILGGEENETRLE